MKLGDILRGDAIALDFKAPDKWKAIELLVDLLVERGRCKKAHRKPVLEGLIARENIASTGMEHGVALPHASIQVLDEPLAALGISPKGIQFQSADGEPAKLIMLLAIPKRNVQLHIRTLAGVARLMNFEEMRTALLDARTPKDAIGIIQAEEEKELA
jgi:mannitol/fructose-specific phosphotransferase system IIA component (Ntr-type)